MSLCGRRAEAHDLRRPQSGRRIGRAARRGLHIMLYVNHNPGSKSSAEKLELPGTHPIQLIYHQLLRQLEEIEQSIEWFQERMNYFGQVWADGL